MEQKVPKISDNDINRIIKRDYPQSEFTRIESILKMYKSNSEEGKNRIYAAILKLSEGNVELIKNFVEKANYDFRDIIALSEYPNYSRYAFDNNLTEQKRKQLIDDDWFQYENWLNR